jgi:outer membrane protein TolC
MENNMRFLKAAAAVLILSGLLTGCAVTTREITRQDIMERIKLDQEVMFKDQEIVSAPITLEEAMARAIKYNLEHRTKIMEDAIALNQAGLVTYDMLPRLVANAGYNDRSNVNGSSSTDVLTGEESLSPSTSQDQERRNSDLSMSWNILDFGVSYFQAKQQADRAHIIKERRRKVVHIIMQQTQQAYWLALGAQQLEKRFESLLQEVEKAFEDVESVEKENLRPPLATLNYKKKLLGFIKQLEAFRDQLAQAKPRLATLMNLPPGQPYTIAATPEMIIPELNLSVSEMETSALAGRPELIEADYNVRISIDETRKTLSRLLPGIELAIGRHYDSNSYLVNQNWTAGSMHLTWNLMNLLSGPIRYDIAKSQTEIAKYQRLVLSAAIMTQVHVSFRHYASCKRQYLISEKLQDLDARIYEQIKNQAVSGSQNHLNEIQSASSSLMTTYQKFQNYASVQNAYGQIKATLGYDPLPENVPSYDLQTLSKVIYDRLYSPLDIAPVEMNQISMCNDRRKIINTGRKKVYKK